MRLPGHDGARLRLLAEGAVWCEEASTLVVADLHLGKSAAFRARGLAVPEGDDRRDLERLLALARSREARRLVVAGDLFHSAGGLTPELSAALESFLDGLGVPVVLVRGNHDRHLPVLPAACEVRTRWQAGGLAVCHDPDEAGEDEDGVLWLCGHWHPVLRLREGRRASLRVPAFLWRGRRLVLPAFGAFTGGGRVPPQAGDRWFAALAGKVVEVPRALWAG